MGATGGSAVSGVTNREDASLRAATASRLDDLGPRVASGLVLAAFGLGVTIAGGPWIAGATGAAVVIMSYEWTRMSEPKSLSAAFAFCVIGALGAVMAASWGHYTLAFAVMAFFGIASAVRRRSLVQAIETAGGVFYIGAPCVLFLALRGHQPEGATLILALFAIIWSADAFAYFGGKLIGGPKLVPNLSPAKTWSGFASGTLAGMAAAAGFAAYIGGPPALWAFIGALLALIGLFGDLFESLVKRRFGVKDASRVIPGHGGVLDRIDGLMAATVTTAVALAVAPGLWLVLLGRSV